MTDGIDTESAAVLAAFAAGEAAPPADPEPAPASVPEAEGAPVEEAPPGSLRDDPQLAELLNDPALEGFSEEEIEQALDYLAELPEEAQAQPEDPLIEYAISALEHQQAGERIAGAAADRLLELTGELRAEYGDEADLERVQALAMESLPDIKRRHGIEGEEAVRVALREAGDKLYPAADETEVVRRSFAQARAGVSLNEDARRAARRGTREEREAAMDKQLADEAKEHGEPKTEAEALERFLRRRERS